MSAGTQAPALTNDAKARATWAKFSWMRRTTAWLRRDDRRDCRTYGSKITYYQLIHSSSNHVYRIATLAQMEVVAPPTPN